MAVMRVATVKVLIVRSKIKYMKSPDIEKRGRKENLAEYLKQCTDYKCGIFKVFRLDTNNDNATC